MSANVETINLHPSIITLVDKPAKMFIDGEWVSAISGETLPVYDPATGEVITNVPSANGQDIDQAVAAARRAFEGGPWPKLTPSERSKMIWRLGDLILEHQNELAQLESLDVGKPIGVATAADIPLAADIFHYMAGWPTKLEGSTIPLSIPYTPGAQYHAYTLREPVGVVGQIIPWNFPLLMAAWKLAPALATGCCIVIKLAEETPLTGLKLGALIEEAGIPKGVVNIITGYGETAGAALAAHPNVDKVAFTGSTEVGKSILQAAAGNLKKVTLELGGKSPNIIMSDADLDIAIPGAASAIFFNHGQCCTAGSRLYVEQNIFDQVVEGVSTVASKMKLGKGLDPSTEMGPLVSETQLNRVCKYLKSGLEEGANAIVGGKRTDGKGYFVEPTVLVNTKPDMKVVREEIFGPVVVATPFESDDMDVVQHANDSVYGLAAGIWTKDISKAHTLAAKLQAGMVWINCYNIFDAAMPFGGYKQSGWGREMGKEVLQIYTEHKSICTCIG